MNFLKWHYTTAFKYFVAILHNYFAFVFHYFSIPLLLKTLFWRFRRLDLTEKKPGFHFEIWLGNIIENFVSRFIGFITRFFVIFAGFIAILGFGVLAVILLLSYLIFPFITLLFYLKVKRGGKVKVSNIADFFNSSYGQFFLDKLGVSFLQLCNTPLPFSQGPRDSYIGNKGTLPNETATGITPLKQAITPPPVQLPPSGTDAFFSEQTLQGVLPTEFFLRLCENWEPLKKYLKENNISKEDLDEIVSWYQRTHSFKEKVMRFWDMDNLLKIGSIGSILSFGYTNFLDQYCLDITATYQKRSYYSLYGRKAQLKQLEESLLQSEGKNVTIITGVKGVGKHSLIYNLAEKIDLHHIPLKLRDKRVLMLNTETFLSAYSKETAPAKFIEIMEEGGRAGNIVVVVDAFEKILSAKYGVDLFSVFVKAKNYDFPPIIGVMEISFFNEICAGNDIISDLFSVVKVEETNAEDSLKILEDFANEAFYKDKVVITLKALRAMVALSNKFLINEPKPERVLAVFNRVLASVSSKDYKIVNEDSVKEAVSKMVGVPVAGSKEENEKLLNIASLIHERLIDQEPAIEALSKALRRVRTGVSASKRPSGAFLFLGPTGVGKTETAKALADIYFGAEKYLLRFDMAEYQGESALERLIGFFKDDKPGALTSTLKNNPFGVLLLDEIEKAERDVLNLFLTVLDEGYITDAFGNKVSAENLIIIATSNAGAEYIRTYIKEGREVEKLSGELTEFVLREKIFSPEFINRFDAVVVYKPLSNEEIKLVADLMLKRLAKKVEQEKGIVVQYASGLMDKIIREGYDPVFGGRSVRRYIQDEVEDAIAREILENNFKSGDVIRL
ncbi:MAG: AAA family ATPase [Patescibacteria group bacterium]|nr:AAA family ATPase [Patescibacteria group bacterium]